MNFRGGGGGTQPLQQGTCQGTGNSYKIYNYEGCTPSHNFQQLNPIHFQVTKPQSQSRNINPDNQNIPQQTPLKGIQFIMKHKNVSFTNPHVWHVKPF